MKIRLRSWLASKTNISPYSTSVHTLKYVSLVIFDEKAFQTYARYKHIVKTLFLLFHVNTILSGLTNKIIFKEFQMNTYMQTNIINLLMQKCVCEIPMPTVQCYSWIIRIIQVYVLRKYRNQMLFMNIKNYSRQCVQEVHKSNAKVLTCYCNRCFDISRIQ